jgi:hypothetical protein
MKSKKKAAKARKNVVAVKKVDVRQESMEKSAVTPFKWLLIIYALFFLAHVAVVALASSLFPSQVVLGTHMLSPFMALLYSMGVFTIITVGALPVIEGLSKATGMKLQDMHWMVIYYVVNFVGLWLTARFAEMLGMGVANWTVVAVMALIIDIVQGLIIKNLPSDMS